MLAELGTKPCGRNRFYGKIYPNWVFENYSFTSIFEKLGMQILNCNIINKYIEEI